MPACSTACSVPGTCSGESRAAASTVGRHRVPERPGDEAGRRQVEGFVAERRMRPSVSPVVAHDLARHLHRAEVQLHASDRPRRFGREDRDVRLRSHLRVLVVVDRLDDGGAVVEVERCHTERLSLMHIDRARMHRLERAGAVDGADETTVVLGDAVLLRRSRAQTDAGRGRPSPAPHRAPVAQHEPVAEHELAHPLTQVFAPPPLVVERERRLVGRAREMRKQHERVGEVDDGGLRAGG